MLDTKQPVQSVAVAVVEGGMVLKCNPKECTSNNNNNNINNAIKFKQLPELKSNFVVSSGTLIITHKAFAAAPVHASSSPSCSNSGGCGGGDVPIVPGEKCNATAKPMTVAEEKEREG